MLITMTHEALSLELPFLYLALIPSHYFVPPSHWWTLNIQTQTGLTQPILLSESKDKMAPSFHLQKSVGLSVESSFNPSKKTASSTIPKGISQGCGVMPRTALPLNRGVWLGGWFQEVQLCQNGPSHFQASAA